MRSRLVIAMLALVALCCLAGAEAAMAKPQSFARWVVQEGTAEDAIIEPMTDRCVKRFPRNDAKLGACVVQGLLALRPALVARWERGVGNIARGQTTACKQAIHAYWLAARKNIKATSLYFESHRHAGSTRIQAELNSQPYTTLESQKDEAKSHAVAVCG
jgi:hypothetical protein